MVKSLPAMQETGAGSIPGWGGAPGGGHGSPLQYACLESPPDRGAWGATVHRATKSWTRQSTQTRCSLYFSTDNFSQFRPVKYIAGIFRFLKCGYGTSLAVQWLRLSSAAGDVSSASVKELRSHMPCSAAKKKKKSG